MKGQRFKSGELFQKCVSYVKISEIFGNLESNLILVPSDENSSFNSCNL